MGLWIIIGLYVVAIIIQAVVILPHNRHPWVDWMNTAALTLAAFAFIGGIFLGCVIEAQTHGGGQWEHQKTWGLRALVTKESVESHAEATYFLGFGTASADSTTVKSISYIRTAKDGGSTLQKSSIHDAVIYEDGGKSPRVEDWKRIGHNDGAWVPWPFEYENQQVGTQHRFHIPAGSILQNYEVKP